LVSGPPATDRRVSAGKLERCRPVDAKTLDQVPPIPARSLLEAFMANAKGPNIKKKQKCKNCEGKGLLKKGDKVVKCQRCGGTGLR
jgi:DnaJ-class molecular chaperone